MCDDAEADKLLLMSFSLRESNRLLRVGSMPL